VGIDSRSFAPDGLRSCGRDPVTSLEQPPASLNTDWLGTLLMQGLLDWGRRGIGEIRELADARLSFHLSSKRLSPYSGARSREVNAGGITMTAGPRGFVAPSRISSCTARGVIGVAW